MVVMITADVGIVCKRACQQGVHRRVRLAADAAVELDTGLRQCHLRTAADTAANQGIHAPLHQEASQRAVAAAVGVHHFLPDDLAVRHFIELELLRVAEVLENLTVFIGNCDFHIRFSFLFVIGFVECPHPAAAAAVRMLLPAADAVIPAGDAQRLSVDKTRRDLLPGAFVDLLYGGTGNVHLGSTLLMGTLFQIHQPDDLIFVQRQQNRRSAPAPVRAEGIDLRFAADPSAPRWSRHSYAPFVFGICRL